MQIIIKYIAEWLKFLANSARAKEKPQQSIPDELKGLGGMHAGKIEYLKKNAPYYPKVHIERWVDKDYMVTKVFFASHLRYMHEGAWYKRLHCSERVVCDELYEDLATMMRKEGEALNGFLHEVYIDMLFGEPMLDIDEKDSIQISEAERLYLF